MKKYLFTYKSELMSNFQYIFNLVTGLIMYFIFILSFQYLWKYIYSDSSQLINGYNLGQMIWYVTITEIIILSSGGSELVKNIANDFKTGNIAYNLNKPYDYILYKISSKLGRMTTNYILFLIVGLILGYIFVGYFPNLTAVELIIFLIISILGIIVNLLILTAIGLLSFYFEDPSPIYWIYSKIIVIVGTLFPIEFFPEVIGNILKYSPIMAITYGPASMFINYSYSNIVNVVIIQIIYIVVVLLLCKFIYKKGVKKLNVNGG